MSLQVFVIGVLTKFCTHRMVFVAFKTLGKGGGVVGGEYSIFTHYIYYVGNEVAVEGGVLLLAWLIYYGFYLWQREDVAPYTLIAVVPVVCYMTLYSHHIFHYLSLALFTLCLLHCLIWSGSRLWLVTIIMVDDGGGVGVVVLHSAYMYLPERYCLYRDFL